MFVPDASVREDATQRASVFVGGTGGKARFEKEQFREKESDYMDQFTVEHLMRNGLL